MRKACTRDIVPRRFLSVGALISLRQAKLDWFNQSSFRGWQRIWAR
jgi:hypothetical protein